jgi:hypothetical protein
MFHDEDHVKGLKKDLGHCSRRGSHRRINKRTFHVTNAWYWKKIISWYSSILKNYLGLYTEAKLIAFRTEQAWGGRHTEEG